MNKYHEEQFNNIKVYIERVERDNKFLLNEIEKYDNLQARIDKAIKYLEEYNLKGVKLVEEEWYRCIVELLDILKGKDKDE